MTPQAFEIDHKLVKGIARVTDHDLEEDGSLTVPEGNEMKDYMEWVNRLPEREPPTYLGLPSNAEKLLLVGHGGTTIANLARITDVLDETEQLSAESAEDGNQQNDT